MELAQDLAQWRWHERFWTADSATTVLGNLILQINSLNKPTTDASNSAVRSCATVARFEAFTVVNNPEDGALGSSETFDILAQHYTASYIRRPW